jgi:hypothetical protein
MRGAGSPPLAKVDTRFSNSTDQDTSARLMPDALGVSRPVHARPPAASGLLNKATLVLGHCSVAVVYDRWSALIERRYKPPIGHVDSPLLEHYARRALGTPAPPPVSPILAGMEQRFDFVVISQERDEQVRWPVLKDEA